MRTYEYEWLLNSFCFVWEAKGQTKPKDQRVKKDIRFSVTVSTIRCPLLKNVITFYLILL